MMWALVFMAASGKVNIPEYVQLYETRKECIAKMPESSWFYKRSYCIPVESQK